MLEKLWRRGLIAVTALGAVVASFFFLTELAIHAGWPIWAAPFLPLCIDALAAMALTQYRSSGNKSAARVAVGAIVLSAVGNAASHWFSAGLLDPNWLAITLVGAVPAVALGICIHLVTSSQGANKWDTNKSVGGSGSRSASSQSTGSKTPRRSLEQTGSVPGVSASAGTRTKRPKRTDEQLLRTIQDNGWSQESGTKLTKLLGVSKSRALELKKQLQPVP